MKIKYPIIATVFLLLIARCTFAKHTAGAEVAESIAGGGVCKINVDYLVVSQSVFGPKCIACHSSGGSLVSLDNFASVQSNILKIEAAVLSNSMPPGKPLSIEEKNTITAWVDAGAPEIVTPVAEEACSDTPTAENDVTADVAQK